MAGYIGSKAVNLSTTGADINGNANIDGNLSFRDNDKAIFGAGSDLQIYHDGTRNYIDSDTTELRLQTSELRMVNSANTEVGLKAVEDGAVTLYYDANPKLATSNTGVDITGNANFADNGKAIFGAGSDLSIYHNGSSSFIEDSGTGGLTTRSNLLTVQNAAGTETVAQFVEDGFVKLFHNNSQVFTTISSGASITGSLGIGTSTPEALLDVVYNLPDDTHGIIRPLKVRTTDTANDTNLLEGDGVGILFEIPDQTASSIGASIDAVKADNSDDITSTSLLFKTSANNETLNEAMRIDSSGNLLVGTTDTSLYDNSDGSEGVRIAEDHVSIASNARTVFYLNRQTSDGEIINVRKNGTTVGSIGVNNTDNFFISGNGAHAGLEFLGVSIGPHKNGSLVDNTLDVGSNSYRFDDIYATNVAIQTSDRNEKQDIAELTDAEQRVAVACKGLMRKFRWIDAVAKKGDDARIHCGIIAQDLQAAFAAEGLDAGRYAMFISTTWWEHDVEVPAVEAVAEVLDEEGNVVTEAVEAKDAYTRTDTYDTQEEAPEGATERTRLGVRYSELLAFIIGAL